MAQQQVIRQSLKDQIKTILIDRMIEGSLAPGDRIKELQVAKEFGTSQAPVREAIRCLETLGYVDHVPHVGAMVKAFDRKEVEEAYQVREALEVHAVSLVIPGLKVLVDDLQSYLRDMRRAVKAGNTRLFIKADNGFHRAIVQCANNETMLTVWDSLRMQLQVMATLVKASMPLQEIYVLHPPIVKALQQEMYADAAQLLKGHYTGVSKYWNKS